MSFIEESLASTAAELFGAEGKVVGVEALVELGWAELFAEEPKAAVSVLAETQGRSLGVSRLIEMVLATQLEGHLDPSSSALVLPLRSLSLVDTGSLGAGLLLDGAPEEVAVPVDRSGSVCLARGVVISSEVAGIDPDAHVRRPTGLEVTEVVALPSGAWDRATSLGLLFVAHETLGVVNALMDLAVAHVTDRHQFGAPLGSFQAVQHRLADVHVEREAARVVADLAWEDRHPTLCAAALGAARRAFVAARIHCHQVMGAMGFTWEHDQHRYLRRGLLLELLLDHRPGLAQAVDTVIVSKNRSEVWT
jgi:hypothetical protein